MELRMGQRLWLGYGAMALGFAAVGVDGLAREHDGGLLTAMGAAGVAGALALAWWTLRGIATPLRQAGEYAQQLAQGDIHAAGPALAAGELGDLQRALQRVGERMFEVVAKVRTSTAAVATTSSIITGDNTALSQRTESQASSLEETAASMEQMTATVKQNADSAQQAYALVHQTTASATRGGEVGEQVAATMDSIKKTSSKISEIIGVIDGIAFQTNILALNAAVEAARAGEQGRGFAVVATEVRALSQRSATAAKEIKTLILESVQEVEQGVQLVGTAGQVMQDIRSSVEQVAEFMRDISAASKEQSAGLDEISSAVMQIDAAVQKNGALVELASHTASNLQDQAADLLAIVADFRLGQREFGTAEEAEQMVKRGVEYIHQHGPDAFVAEVQLLNRSQFVDRDLYFSVYDLHAKCLANGANPRYVGVDGNVFKDIDGKFFVKETVAQAKAQGSGWMDYKHPHPITKQYQAKTTYFERAGDLVVCCGFYRH